MKKTLLIVLVACFIGVSGGLQAQNVVKINILSPIVKTINVSYERAINENGSFQLGFFYTGWSNDLTKFSGFGITPEYRFYLSDSPAPEGVYVAPFIRYQKFNISDKDVSDSEADFSAFGGGVVIGKQWVFKDKITLDLFLGPAYYSGKVSGQSGNTTFDTDAFDGFGLRTGINFGFKF
ncbi:MAG: DUF3575 domain-containing protein [Cyclobacteriaceae bacterium]|nr:MAG: DUF3575 domain-containing protein [Cyclobacteriaceae bacterium]